MWQVENRTPFACDRAWVRDREGAEVWLVAVKATYDVHLDGSTTIARVQPPVLREPEWHGPPGASSVKYESDLVLTKRTTDVVAVAHACVPGGGSATQVDVGLRVGAVRKVLRVFGDRVWGPLGISVPHAFQSMPIVYERAYGGVDVASPAPHRDWDWRNPVGQGHATSGRRADGRPLPNIESHSERIASWNDRPAPAGLGAIASHWQPRAALAGTYDARWRETRQPLLPTDFDDRFFQCAPADQQAPTFLRGGEPVTMVGLNPCGPLRFDLPKLYLGFETLFFDGDRSIHAERRLHTVILEPDFPRVSLVWHSALPCHFKVHKLDRTVVTVKRGLSTAERVHDEDDLEFTV